MAIKRWRKPIFIIGYERSGTTLLMAMLGAILVSPFRKWAGFSRYLSVGATPMETCPSTVIFASWLLRCFLT